MTELGYPREPKPHTDRARRPRHLVPRPHPAMTLLTGLVAFLVPAVVLAPGASATYLPPGPHAPAGVTPSVAAALADLPASVIVILLAGTVLTSVTTTLATLSVVHRRDQRIASKDPADVPIPVCSAGHHHEPEDILVSHPYGPG